MGVLLLLFEAESDAGAGVAVASDEAALVSLAASVAGLELSLPEAAPEDLLG